MPKISIIRTTYKHQDFIKYLKKVLIFKTFVL